MKSFIHGVTIGVEMWILDRPVVCLTVVTPRVEILARSQEATFAWIFSHKALTSSGSARPGQRAHALGVTLHVLTGEGGVCLNGS